MKITNSTPVPTTSTTGKANVAKADVSRATPQSSTNAPDLQSPAVKKALEASSEVDMNRVNQMRQAIGEGRVSLDPDGLADAILGMHRS